MPVYGQPSYIVSSQRETVSRKTRKKKKINGEKISSVQHEQIFSYQRLFNNKTTSIVFSIVLSIVNNLERIKVFWEMGD